MKAHPFIYAIWLACLMWIALVLLAVHVLCP